MDFSDIFRIVNLVVGTLMVLGGVAQNFGDGHGLIKGIVVSIYCILFGLGTGGLEFQIPPIVSKYASFMFSFVGRGVFYLFIGSIMLGNHWYQWLPGSLVGFIGIGYIVLEFIPSIEPPANMRDADPSWGSEQI